MHWETVQKDRGRARVIKRSSQRDQTEMKGGRDGKVWRRDLHPQVTVEFIPRMGSGHFKNLGGARRELWINQRDMSGHKALWNTQVLYKHKESKISLLNDPRTQEVMSSFAGSNPFPCAVVVLTTHTGSPLEFPHLSSLSMRELVKTARVR